MTMTLSGTTGVQLPNGNKELVWYEESTWTPTLSASSPGTLSATLSVSYATYTRIGRMCHISARFSVSSFTLGTATGTLRIYGLPYQCNSFGAVGSCFLNNVDTGGSAVVVWIPNGAGYNFVEFYSSNDNAAWASTSISGVSVNDELIISASYTI